MANEPELAEAADILVADYMDVSKTDRVVITTDTATDACAVEAVLAAVVGTGAEVAVVKVFAAALSGNVGGSICSRVFGQRGGRLQCLD